jgi:hypothetical protein
MESVGFPLVNATRHILATEHLDRPLDLAPMAEMNDVAERTAAIRPIGGFDRRQFAIFLEEIAGLRQGRAIENMNMMSHANSS